MTTEPVETEPQPESLADIKPPDFKKIADKGYTLGCGSFFLDHDKSEFEMAEIAFKNQVGARIIVSTKEVVMDHWKKDGATGNEYDHGWIHHWHVKFFGSHWKEQEFRGRAKSVQAAKAMAYNMVLGLWIGMGLKPTKPFQEAEMEALRAEVRSLRYDKSLIGYVLRTDEPKAYQRVKHYFKAGR